jgi:hypothetical protein
MRVFQELLTHLNRRRDFTGSNNSKPAWRSSGTKTEEGAADRDMADCDEYHRKNSDSNRNVALL